jgi:rod shape-determining protein MreC
MKNRFLIALIIILIFLALYFFQKEVKSFFYSISSPIQKTLWKTGGNVSNTFSGVFESKKLKEENIKLNFNNQGLSAEIAALSDLKKENEDLRSALGVGLNEDFKLVFVQTIEKDITQDFIRINAGSEDGLSENLPVVTSQKVLVGRISEVYNHYSKVMLIFNKDSSFDAGVSGGEIYGIIKGKGGLKVSLELVPRDSEIKEGDQIITVALGGIFPKGILVGQIKKIYKSDVDPFQSADIDSSFNINNLENLFVITNPND